VFNLARTDEERKLRYAKQLEIDRKAEKLAIKAQQSKDAKDRAKAAVAKRPGHDDPFVYSPGLAYGNFDAGVAGGRRAAYWGVAAGAGAGIGVVGAYAAWGMADGDPHCRDGATLPRGWFRAGRT
jgi:hypothetical protein